MPPSPEHVASPDLSLLIRSVREGRGLSLAAALSALPASEVRLQVEVIRACPKESFVSLDGMYMLRSLNIHRVECLD